MSGLSFDSFGVEVAAHCFPAEGSEKGAYQRTDYHNPEIRPSSGAPESRAEAAGGVHRAVVDSNAYDVDKAECQTDSYAGELAEAYLGVSGTEHYQHEKEGKQSFYH